MRGSGGKSTQIAARLNGKGVLVTNDIHAERTKALAKNIELYGVRNAVVLNEAPERIARAFPHYFDKILIDAPCSGEGMFRKDEDMARQWERHSIEKCTVMQRDILKTAAAMLAPGGRIVYSTCTFAPEENEAMIAEFLLGNPDFEVVPVPRDTGITPGRPDWLDWLSGEEGGVMASVPEEVKKQTAGCGRLWPHKVEGEGHFVAVLERNREAHAPEAELAGGHERIASRPNGKSRGGKAVRPSLRSRPAAGADKKGLGEREMLESWRAFAAEHLRAEPPGTPLTFGGNVYLSPVAKEQLDGLKVVRPGWYAGTVKTAGLRQGIRWLRRGAFRGGQNARLVRDGGEAVRYLKGETLEIEASRVHTRDGANPKGYVLVTVDGYSLGWGKWQNGLLKNEYPAGWRWT
ncbi:23S rRNA methyltransferase [Paenibacillus macerans]|nr:23S rRNA methyltransferase [Paenibacillus macerans]